MSRVPQVRQAKAADVLVASGALTAQGNPGALQLHGAYHNFTRRKIATRCPKNKALTSRCCTWCVPVPPGAAGFFLLNYGYQGTHAKTKTKREKHLCLRRCPVTGRSVWDCNNRGGMRHHDACEVHWPSTIATRHIQRLSRQRLSRVALHLTSTHHCLAGGGRRGSGAGSGVAAARQRQRRGITLQSGHVWFSSPPRPRPQEKQTDAPSAQRAL